MSFCGTQRRTAWEFSCSPATTKPLFPFYERSGSIGDGLETARMAGGAITAEYGKTLDVEESNFCHPTRWLM